MELNAGSRVRSTAFGILALALPPATILHPPDNPGNMVTY
ncbi:unnamed protein product, partial [marine sediment metagenome]